MDNGGYTVGWAPQALTDIVILVVEDNPDQRELALLALCNIFNNETSQTWSEHGKRKESAGSLCEDSCS
jgi:hypothetical protein